MKRVFLGMPHQSIIDWINGHSYDPPTPPTPTARAETRIWWSDDEFNWEDYLIEGTLDQQIDVDTYAYSAYKVEVGSAVTSIGQSAFYTSSTLTDIKISNSVTTIKDSAFFVCQSLTTITIPDSITSIANNAFYECNNIATVTIVANGGNAANVKQMMIAAGCPINITWNMPSHSETIFTLQNGTVETYNITGTLDKQWLIDNGYYDENNYEWIKTVTQADIGNTVTNIGDGAFAGCSSLTSMTIGNGEISIGNGAFYYCNGLTSVTIGNGATSIGMSPFQYCNSLTIVTFEGKDKLTVQGMSNYPFGLNEANENGVIIHCIDGDIPISYAY